MDELIRVAAFQWLDKQVANHGGILPRNLLEQGFQYQGLRVTLVGASGIWKPRVMELPISLTTILEGPYNDYVAHDYNLYYRYRGTDVNHWNNVLARKAMKKKVPLIYILGVEPNKYIVEWPVYIIDERPDLVEPYFIVSLSDHAQFKKLIHDQLDDQMILEFPVEYTNEYARREALFRLHQGEFRVRVLTAYNEQCAFCRLRHQQLLDAAHIIPDNEGGEPIVPNGLSLCKIHHAAYDNNIVGVNPDYRIIVRDDILEEIDGPMLKYGIQEMHGQKIYLPNKPDNRPGQERLAYRFERFLKAV